MWPHPLAGLGQLSEGKRHIDRRQGIAGRTDRRAFGENRGDEAFEEVTLDGECTVGRRGDLGFEFARIRRSRTASHRP